MKRFLFEGREATIAEIRAIVPCLTDSTVRAHLRAGRNTKQAMLTFDFNAARRRGGQKGRKTVRAQGWF